MSGHTASTSSPNLQGQRKKSSPQADVQAKEPSASQPTIPAHPNYIRSAFATFGKIGSLGLEQVKRLSQGQRIIAGIVATMFLFWPLFTLLMLSPWILGAAVITYSLLFTFHGLVSDLEEAILTETRISEENGKYVKEISKNLQSNWTKGVKLVKQGIERGTVLAIAGYKMAKEQLSQQQAKWQKKSSASPKKQSEVSSTNDKKDN